MGRTATNSPLDFVVVGAGLVGLATARALQARFPDAGVEVLEKEDRVSAHQSGHNSGVIHSGLYYKPGTSKAILAIEGHRRMLEFCQEHGIRHEVCGKVVVATDPSELDRLQELYRRGGENGVQDLREIGPEELKEIEPAASGIAAVHVPGSAICDYPGVAEQLKSDIETKDGVVRLSTRVTGARRESDAWVIETSGGDLRAKFVVTCAGLQSDRAARLFGSNPKTRIVPFRGDYCELVESSRSLVRGLIYPVPDPKFPFLGVHLTKMVDGSVECGPNAVLALAREVYTRTGFKLSDAWNTMTYGGALKLFAKNMRTGLGEIKRAYSLPSFARSLSRLVPSLTTEHIQRAGAGIRAQAVSPDGQLVHDFQFERGENALHVLNAPSPAATACLAIGDSIAAQV